MSFDRRITPIRADLADERLRGQIEAERFTAGTLKRVVASFSPLHRHPSREAPVDTQAIFGESVTVYDEHEGWAWVQLNDDGYVGYLPSEALGEPGAEPTHRVRAIRTFIYPGPNLKLPYRDYLTLNARVTVTATEGDYARLATGGWVYRPASGRPRCVRGGLCERRRALPAHALSLGRQDEPRHRLLGAGADGADGRRHRGAARQRHAGARARGHRSTSRRTLSGLRRGDLVFWKGHVGLMMDASNFIHATGHSMTVMIEPLAIAEERIRRTSYGPISAIKRLG